MRSRLRFLLVGMTLLVVSATTGAQRFSFSEPDADAQAEQAMREQREDRVAEQLSTPCRNDLRNKKIMVVIGERASNGIVTADQENYGPHYEAVNRRLRALGLSTYTPEEIRQRIAQAEIDAHFRNDPDAALSAAKRLGASFVLRGLITSEATRNPMMRLNQVSVRMGFTLTGSNGRLVSSADASSASYAGSDVARMALTLVNEQAEEVVATLYADYCNHAGLGAKTRPVNRAAPPRRTSP